MKGGRELWKWRAVESVENQKQVFPSFHSPLEISPKAGEIPHPTAPATHAVESGNQKQVSHFPTAFSYMKEKQKRKRAASPSALRGGASRLAASRLRTKMSVVDERKDKTLLTDAINAPH